MESTTVWTRQQEEKWQEFVPFLPHFLADADSRDEILDELVVQLQEVAMHIDVSQLQISDALRDRSTRNKDETLWHLYGCFKDDPISERLFDEAEKERDKYWIGGTEDDAALVE